MKDIAEQAGVSQPTVSLVLAGRRDVRLSEETRRRVIEVAKKLNYRPDGTARNLVTGRTRSVAFVYDQSALFLLDDPFCRAIFSGVIAASQEEGLSIIFAPCDAEHPRIDAMERRLVDGVLYLAAKHPEPLAAFRHASIPVVLVNPDLEDPPAFSSVTLDDEAAGKMAAQKVKAAGRDHVLFLSAARGRRPAPSYRARLEAFRKVLPSAEHVVLQLDGELGDSYRAGLGALALVRDDTAVVTVNDQIGWGLLDALRAAGRRVPGEVSIVGFDGLTRRFDHAAGELATVRFNQEAIGRAGMGLLGKLIEGAKPRSVVIAPEWRAGKTLAEDLQ